MPKADIGVTSLARASNAGGTVMLFFRHRSAEMDSLLHWIGVAVVASASHRPSDAIGAALVVTAWAATVAAVLVLWDDDKERKPAAAPRSTI